MSKSIIYLLITIFLLNACGVSYPKETLVQSLEKLIQKECGQDSKAYIFGKTLYLDIELDGLISREKEAATQAIHKMHTAVFSVVRVVLSSDSNIQYMVATAYDHGKNVAVRIVQNINDVKSYFYGRISRSDCESRKLLEICNTKFSEKMISDKHDITVGEYVGRLIVSQINMMSSANSFFGALMSDTQLQYLSIKNENLILLISNDIDIRVITVLEGVLKEELKNYSKKYNMFFDKIIVIKPNGKNILSVSLDAGNIQSVNTL